MAQFLLDTNACIEMQIAAIARSKDFILITHNSRELNRVHRLRIEDWGPS
jgi:predicted nucleic acid-binding protein